MEKDQLASVAINEGQQVLTVPSEPTPVLEPLEAPNGDGQHVAVATGYEIKHLPGREVGLRNHRFDDVRSFAAWLNRHATAPTQTEVLLSAEEVNAVLDPGSAAPEILHCKLKLHPIFEAWRAAFGLPLAQKAFHELARGFRHSLSEPELILAALRVVKLAKTGELQSTIDETGATRLAVQSASAELTAKLPPEFVVTCPVYQGIVGTDGSAREYRLEVLLSLDLDGAGPLFTLTCPSLELVKNDARQDVAAMLERELDAGFLVGLGEYGQSRRKAAHVGDSGPMPGPATLDGEDTVEPS